MKDELKALNERMEEAADNENYERAARYKMRISQLEEKLKEWRHKAYTLHVTSDDIAETIGIMTNIPVKSVMKSEAHYLLQLENKLSRHIIGQKDAIAAVSKAIRRNRSGITMKNRPIGSFIFLGPTGVGKTELARVLAREYFADESTLIKIDMSEFSERHTAARLVGAPAGYVGYEEGGELTEKVRRRPYSLLLFDEIEKAHPDVFNLLLQVLEDGFLTDAKGRHVDFRNTVVILTSNVGAQKLQKEAVLGFRARDKDNSDPEANSSLQKYRNEQALDELKRLMRPELLNRFDKIVVFDALTKDDAKKVLELQLNDLANRLKDKHLHIKLVPAAKEALLSEGFDPINGVRPLRRIIEEKIEDVIAEGILRNEYKENETLQIRYHDGAFVFGQKVA
jgi:ATP-dependent Clp protease ATP-binding subunit ClpC